MQADLRSGVAPTVQGEPRQIFGIDLPTQGMHLDSYVSALAWSPNSVYLALSVRDTRVGDTYTHRLADRHGKVVEIECGAGDDGQWSPNGSRYACGLKNGKLVIFEPPTGGRVERFTAADATDFLSNIHWSPDGTAIALFHGRMAKGPEGGPASRSLVTIDVNSGKESVLIPDIDAVVGKRWTPGDIQWSPNGKLISFSTREELFLLDVMTRRVKKLVVTNQIERVKEQELALMDCPRWSLDGEALVFQFHIGERFTDEGHIHDRALYVYDLRSQKARKLLDKPMGWCLEILPRSPSSLPR